MTALRSLAEWDEDYLRSEIAVSPELSWLEKKASARIALTSRNVPDAESKLELAKQVSAFSNAGQGYLVYGITSAGQFDGGVPTMIGNRTIKEWAESVIPDLVHPQATQCEARMFQLSSIHSSQHCVLAISIPLSDSRPHWVNSDDTAYIRAGEHSLPMKPQTFLDIASRGDAAQVEIVGLNPGTPTFQGPHHSFPINPCIQLMRGPVCNQWALELTTHGDTLYLRCPDSNEGIRIATRERLYLMGTEPLFPGRPTSVVRLPISLEIDTSLNRELSVSAVLYAGSAFPSRRTFHKADWDPSFAALRQAGYA